MRKKKGKTVRYYDLLRGFVLLRKEYCLPWLLLLTLSYSYLISTRLGKMESSSYVTTAVVMLLTEWLRLENIWRAFGPNSPIKQSHPELTAKDHV